jgi:hypothetical protein
VRADMLTLLDGTKLDKDLVAGVITMSTIPDREVDGAKLNQLWAAEGLDQKLIPDVRKPVNVFEQACRSVETRRAATNNANQQAEVKVDRVVNDGTHCVYQVTRLVRDLTNQVIDHPKAMRIVFDKAAAETLTASSDVIDIQPLDPTTYGALKGLADAVVDYYDSNLATVPGQKIRNAVRDYMKILGAENLRRKSGGVYFVPTSGIDTLECISRVLEQLYGGDADLHIIAQPKTKAVMKMVAKHHVLNVQADADEMISEIVTRLKQGGKVRKDKMTNIMQARRELGQRRKQYVQILGTEHKLIQEKLSILDDEIERLMAAAM